MVQSHQAFAPGRGDGNSSQPATTPADKAALIQSRETGGVIPDEMPRGQIKALPFAKSWIHFMAGGIGGMTAAALTAPLDVLKTRLQSDMYQAQLRAAREAVKTGTAQALAPAAARNPLSAAFYHLYDTMHILRTVQRTEGSKALFKGLGPNLVGVIPARSIHFYVYGNGKNIIAERFNRGQEAPWVHMTAAAAAGIATATATNPIWVIKTRMQLDKNIAQQRSGGAAAAAAAAAPTEATAAATQMHRRYRNSFDCIKQIMRQEGIPGLYKGMSASYLGAAETTLQWVLYEQLKAYLARREHRIEKSGRERTIWDHSVEWMGGFGAAGTAKFIAAILAYPHEVVRTRMRQAPTANGRLKYTGLVQCFKLVWREEGMMGLYGGLTPHLLRTVPSAAIMFAMYEGILRLCNARA